MNDETRKERVIIIVRGIFAVNERTRFPFEEIKRLGFWEDIEWGLEEEIIESSGKYLLPIKVHAKRLAAVEEFVKTENIVLRVREGTTFMDDASMPEIMRRLNKAMGGPPYKMTPIMLDELMDKPVEVDGVKYQSVLDFYEKNPVLLTWVKERWSWYFQNKKKTTATEMVKILKGFDYRFGPLEYLKKNGGQVTNDTQKNVSGAAPKF